MPFAFNPATGLLDVPTFPTTPANETAGRQQFMTLFNQLRDYMNSANMFNADNSPGANFYQKFPNGRIIQWGNASLSSGGLVNFGIVFPTAVRCVVVTLETNSGYAWYSSATTSKFQINHSAGTTTSFSYFAVGD